MAVISDLYTAQAVAAYWEDVRANEAPYLGEGLFPNAKVVGLDLSWIKGSSGLPISLLPSNFDAKTKLRDRISVEKIDTEMPFFREGILLKEKDRQEMLRVSSDVDDPYTMAVLSRVFDDAAQLLRSARVVPERMRMQLLGPIDGSPAISITAGGATYSYNYDPSGTFEENNFAEITTANDKWSASSTCDPIGELQEGQDAVEALGHERPTIALMNENTFRMFCKSAAVQSELQGAGYIVTRQRVIDLVAELLGMTVVVYGRKFVDETGTTQSFYPDNLVTLLPSTPVGRTFYGTTPEEADLIGRSNPNATVEIVDGGIALKTIAIPDPVNIETVASEIVLPSFEGMDRCYVMKVA